MNFIDTIRRAGRSLKNAKARTLLTSLAIGVGAFTITLSLAAGEGGRNYTDQIVRANSDPKEVIVSQKQPESSEGPRKYDPNAAIQTQSGSGFGGGSDVKFITQKDIDSIKQIADVTEVVPNYSPEATYITTKGADKFLVSSLSAYTPGLALEYAAGSVSENGLAEDEIALNEAYAKALGFSNFADAIGKTVELRVDKLGAVDQFELKPFKVVAVTSDSGLAFRAQGSLLISPSAAKNLYTYVNEGTRGYNNFFLASVRVSDVSKAAGVKEALVNKGYQAQTAEDILGTVNTFINVLQGILIGFGALAVLTSVFGIINTQYISVLERTQQIGLMKALGMRRRDVGRLFKLEAAWIGLLGGVIGSGLAVLAGTAANPLITDTLKLNDISLLVFNPLAVAGVVVGLVLVAVASGILPARKASKLDPVEALRTE